MTTSVTLSGATEILSAYFVDQWADRTAVTLENEAPPAARLPFVRFSVQQVGGGQHTQGRPGNRKFWRTFNVFVQVFSPAKGGARPGRLLADQVVAIMEAKSLSDGEVDTFDAVVTAEPDDQAWKVHLVTVQGAFQEVK